MLAGSVRCAALLILVVLLCGGCDKHAADRDEISNLFRDFQLAVNNRAGEDAASYLSVEAIDWYGQMLRLARDAPAREVRSLSPIEKASVLEIRNRLTRRQINGWTGQDYIVHAVKNGWWAHPEESPWTLRGFRYGTGQASAEVVIDGEPTRQRLRFVTENAAWKYDDRSINDLANLILELAADEEGLSIDEALLKWEEEDSKKVPGPAVWEPMK